MQDLIGFLDFLSRAFAVLLAIGGLLGFVFRRWVGAWIDARFKRQLDYELKGVEHRFALALEEKKAALAKELGAETERLKAILTKDMECEKRELDEQFRRKAQIFEKKRLLYETFQLEYGAIIAELHALVNTRYSDEVKPELGSALRSIYLAKARSMLTEAQKKIAPHEAYASIDHKVRMARLFRDLSVFMADGATDETRLGELAREESMLFAELRNEVLGPAD